MNEILNPQIEKHPSRPATHRCKSGKHTWFQQEDADKCCNGYTRVLVFGGGDNQQLIEGVMVGRRWKKIAPPPKSTPNDEAAGKTYPPNPSIKTL